MSWYRSGTVAVAPGEVTVTGTGTAFSANGRVGDAFQGPDGRWYEVTNIASASVLSIIPAYQGEAVTVGHYALAPMQGYVKESADRLRAITAGLVSVEEDVAAAKQAASDAESSATRAGASATQAGSDRAAAEISAGAALGSEHAADGYRAAAQTSAQNALAYRNAAAGHNSQAAASATAAAASAAAAAQSEQNVANKANSGANSDITSLSGLTTPLSVAQGGTGGATAADARASLGLKSAALADIVGSVSQAAGVPTGAIIESGSNANGEYTRYANGTQICILRSSPVLCNATSLMGTTNWFRTAQFTWTFPVPFAAGSIPHVTPGGEQASNTGLVSGGLTSTPTNTDTAVFAISTVNGGSVRHLLLAVGRWY